MTPNITIMVNIVTPRDYYTNKQINNILKGGSTQIWSWCQKLRFDEKNINLNFHLKNHKGLGAAGFLAFSCPTI